MFRFLIVGLVVLMAGCGVLEEPQEYYPSRDSLVADGAIERGWVPAWFPPSASRINEIHDLDTAEVWIRFELTSTDLESIDACEQDPAVAFGDSHGPRHWDPAWWMIDEEHRWTGYTCDWDVNGQARRGAMVVALDEGVALYWEEL